MENEKKTTKVQLLTRKEVAELLKCSLATIHNWTVNGKLQKYGIGNKVFYKYNEVISALIPL